MFQRLIDDIGNSAGRAMRKTWLMAAIAASLFMTLLFLSAAAFVAVLERYGLIYACLAGAAIFFAVTLISLLCYAVSGRKKQSPPVERPQQDEKSVLETTLANPMMMAAGMQVIRAVGVKRLLPLLAVAGIAFGYFATRGNSSSDDGNDPGSAN